MSLETPPMSLLQVDWSFAGATAKSGTAAISSYAGVCLLYRGSHTVLIWPVAWPGTLLCDPPAGLMHLQAMPSATRAGLVCS